MKKGKSFAIISCVIISILMLSLINPSLAAYQKNATLSYMGISLLVNGKTIIPKDANGNIVDPFVIDGTTYLPVRAVANALGMNVDWIETSNTIMLTKKEIVFGVKDALSNYNCGAQKYVGTVYDLASILDYVDITIQLNDKTVIPKDANGNIVNPFAINGTTYLPIRAIANALGMSVDYLEPTKTIVLSNIKTEDGAAALSIFGTETQIDISEACNEIGLDINLIEDFAYYNNWIKGTVYTFTYEGSVIDMLLYDNGKVFSIDTNGVQVFLNMYEPYSLSDYLGSMAHYDEAQLQNGYAFYVNGEYLKSDMNFYVSDDHSYIVWLTDTKDGSLTASYYISSDAEPALRIAVPTGTYQIQFGVIGSNNLLSDDTHFYQISQPVSVTPDNEGNITLDYGSGTSTMIDGSKLISDFS